MTFCLTNCGGGGVGGVDHRRGGDVNAGGRSTRACMNGCDGTHESIGGRSSMSASGIFVSSTSIGSSSTDTASGNYTSTNVLDLKKFYQRQFKGTEMKMASMQEELNCQ